MSPDSVSLGGQRRDQCRKKLIAHGSPIRVREVLLKKRLGRMGTDSEETAARPEPVYIDAFGFAVEAPNQTSIIRVIFWMDRRSRPERDEVTRICVSLPSVIYKID